MNLKHIFWPWGRIAELNTALFAAETERDSFRRIANRRLDRLEEVRAENTDLSRRLSDANVYIDKLHRDIADLEAFKSKYDQPRVGGRFAAKVA